MSMGAIETLLHAAVMRPSSFDASHAATLMTCTKHDRSGTIPSY